MKPNMITRIITTRVCYSSEIEESMCARTCATSL